MLSAMNSYVTLSNVTVMCFSTYQKNVYYLLGKSFPDSGHKTIHEYAPPQLHGPVVVVVVVVINPSLLQGAARNNGVFYAFVVFPLPSPTGGPCPVRRRCCHRICVQCARIESKLWWSSFVALTRLSRIGDGAVRGEGEVEKKKKKKNDGNPRRRWARRAPTGAQTVAVHRTRRNVETASRPS